MAGDTDRATSKQQQSRDRSVWLAIAFGVASLPSVPAVQWTARRLPLVPLPKWPAVYLSVAVATGLAGVAFYFVCRALRQLEKERGEPVLPTSVVYFGAVLLLAGILFAGISDFARPRTILPRVLPPLGVIGCGLAGYLLMSLRGRAALASEPSRRYGFELLHFSELLLAAALAFALYAPADARLVMAFLSFEAMIAPGVAFLGYRVNRKHRRHGSLGCRLRSAAVGLPFLAAGLVLLPPL